MHSDFLSGSSVSRGPWLPVGMRALACRRVVASWHSGACVLDPLFTGESGSVRRHTRNAPFRSIERTVISYLDLRFHEAPGCP